MNLPTLIVGLVVAALVGCAVAGILRGRKKGGGCSCGCGGCPNAGLCHPPAKR